MPINRRRDSNGSYYQWGDRGAKYYYISNNAKSRERAKNKAILQSIAARANTYGKK